MKRQDTKTELSDICSEIVASTPALIVVLDAGGRITHVNPACERFLGTSAHAVDGKFFWDVCAPEDRRHQIRQILSSPPDGASATAFTSDYITAPGAKRMVAWSASKIDSAAGNGLKYILTGTDMTARTISEDALRESESRLAALCDNSVDVVAIVNADRTLRFVTPSVHALLGYKAEELIGCDVFDFVHPEEYRATCEVFENLLREPGALVRHSHRLRHANGNVRHVDTHARNLLHHTDVQGVIFTTRDMTEHVRADNELQAALGRLRALLDSIAGSTWLKDASGRYLAANRVFAEDVGVDRDKIVGMTDLDIFPEPVARRMLEEDRSIMEKSTSMHIEECRNRDGVERWFEIIKVPIIDGSSNVTGLAGTSRDITERKRTETQRLTRQAEQRRSLIREVHHRVKNHLQGIIMLIEQYAIKNPAFRDVANEIESRVNAIALVHGLHGTSTDPEVNLRSIVEAIIVSLARLYPESGIEFQPEQGFEAVHLASEETVPIALILNELIVNAIKHGAHEAPSYPVTVSTRRMGAAVQIQVRNGGGRVPDSLDFATGAGLGTGLRLVKSLLPAQHAILHIGNRAQGGVLAELTLAPPLLLEALETEPPHLQ